MKERSQRGVHPHVRMSTELSALSFHLGLASSPLPVKGQGERTVVQQPQSQYIAQQQPAAS